MADEAGNPSQHPRDARGHVLGAIAAALLHTVPFGLLAGPVIASFAGWETWSGVAVGGLTGLAFGSAVGTADWLRRRRGPSPGAEPVVPPQPRTAPHPPTVGDLWVAMIGPPVFAGLILCIPLMGTSRGGVPGGQAVVPLIAGAVFVICVTVVCPPRLQELARRGAWVPRGTAAHPYRVAFALTALLMAAVVAVSFAGVWVLQLCGL